MVASVLSVHCYNRSCMCTMQLIASDACPAGPDKKLKLSLNYPASVGRNMDEIVRCVDALQLSAKYSVATPANCERPASRPYGSSLVPDLHLSLEQVVSAVSDGACCMAGENTQAPRRKSSCGWHILMQCIPP